MSKGMFDRLFKFLVKKCNETLDTQQKRQSFIGVLDIAGFEIFDVSYIFAKYPQSFWKLPSFLRRVGFENQISLVDGIACHILQDRNNVFLSEHLMANFSAIFIFKIQETPLNFRIKWNPKSL